MNKKNFLISTLALASIFTATVTSTGVNAAEDAGSAQTKATLKFKQESQDPTDSTKPVNPDNPGEPNPGPGNPDPGDPGNPGTNSAGPLSIDFAPAFDFGVGTISNESKTYSLQDAVYDDGQTRNHKPFVQVTDRRGNGQGWTLNANISKFTNSQASGNPQENLRGAEVKISPKNAPTAGYGSVSDAPTGFSSSIKLSENSQNIMTASNRQGMGTWLQFLDPANITLTVPGGTAIKGNAYSANVTWTLSAGPTV
ncbi:WxL domain-containing protein [Holzapfeliella sp. He02]|uniref:WxL domain-containing protein n=1 Tax=Holzapfeliella saturejae TaxID=3082953 RepID=A0ABU8SH59_9LACO